jgi:type I restriction enzyme, S subunit
MIAWRPIRFGDLVDFHNRRRVPLSKALRATRPGPYPYFGAQGIVDRIDDFIFDGEFLLVAEDGENLRSRKAPIARLATGRFWVNNHAHIVTPKPGLADENFLLHLLNNTPLAGRVTGAAQPKLTKANLADLEFECPPYELQLRIGAFLSAFAKLIEINERRIELLEDLARSLYREWFVHFRFPGHEDVRFDDSELGPLPQGWKAKCLFDVADVAFGYPFKSRHFSGSGMYPVIRIRDVPRGTTDTFTDEEPDLRYQVSDGDVLIGMDGTFYVHQWSGGTAWLNQRVARLRPVGDLGGCYLMHAVRGPVMQLNGSIVGTTVSHLGKRHLQEVRLAVSSRPIREAATGLFEAIGGEQIFCEQQIRALAATRDLLLPRLVSGKLDISDLDLGVLAPAEAE